MPSFQDSVIIFILALILFGPKKLPQLARQLGKLMAEFRRASNDFRMQMEEEMRIVEQEENQKKLAATNEVPAETYSITEPEHPHLPNDTADATTAPIEPIAPEELTPIAQSGDITMRPPSSGYPEPAAASGVRMASSNAGVVATPEAPPAEHENEPGVIHG